ncbi:flagellar motor switch phosphatase FliY [Miltoncostaea marina]|uniref:flagellar motor switch phosphatase FliY n=1 Tax=Miltoncostaea marina TaxID=2843215 RepID=UPI001C3DC4B1|nr:flagellar motor switch phosphatase FliY [Miltoncostaea marina]
MSGGSLSQEEIDALMAGGADALQAAAAHEPAGPAAEPAPIVPADDGSAEPLDDMERDTVGEVGNICMSSAATTLSKLLGRAVQITTPRVEMIGQDEMRSHFDEPALVVVIEYTEGLDGRNAFVLSTRDASVVADVMMGGQGVASESLDDLHVSAISEAMNQMMGSAATAMAEMAGRRVDISAPSVTVLGEEGGVYDIGLEQPVVRTSFQLTVEDLLETTLMQLMPLGFARALVGGLTGAAPAPAPEPVAAPEPPPAPAPEPVAAVPQPPPPAPAAAGAPSPAEDDRHLRAVPVPVAQPVTFPSLDEAPAAPGGSDISLLLDVPLQVTVELGRTQLRIRNVLELVPGSIIELDKLAGEPVDVLVNGKGIARGEVVVIDEEFGVRITDVASQAKRLRGLAAEAE